MFNKQLKTDDDTYQFEIIDYLNQDEINENKKKPQFYNTIDENLQSIKHADVVLLVFDASLLVSFEYC